MAMLKGNAGGNVSTVPFSFWVGRPQPAAEYLLALLAAAGCTGMYGDVRGMGGGLQQRGSTAKG